MAWREIIYQYDGSFEGLLCCVFESYTKKERPTAILRDGDDEPSLFEIRAVTTDRAHAQRIYRSLYKRSPEVGPFLRRHFCERYHNETFFLYDRTHREALLYSGGVSRIVPLNHFEMAQPDEVEAGYRRLWRRFYDTVAIEARKNEKLRMTHMPKRYWGMMTEFQDESYFKARPKETPSASPAPGAPAAIPAPATRPEGAPPAPASAP